MIARWLPTDWGMEEEICKRKDCKNYDENYQFNCSECMHDIVSFKKCQKYKIKEQEK